MVRYLRKLIVILRSYVFNRSFIPEHAVFLKGDQATRRPGFRYRGYINTDRMLLLLACILVPVHSYFRHDAYPDSQILAGAFFDSACALSWNDHSTGTSHQHSWHSARTDPLNRSAQSSVCPRTQHYRTL